MRAKMGAMTTKSDEQALAPLETLMMQQSENNAQMAKYIQQMAQIVLSLDRRINMLETLLSQRVTVTAAQARAVSNAVQAQAIALCAKHGFDYREDGEAFRRAIWRDVKAQFGVKDIHDLPAAYFELAVASVEKWTSFALIRKLRTRHGA